MESDTNNISSAGLHGLDQRQHRFETSEEVDIRQATQGQNALGSLSLCTCLTYWHCILSAVAYCTPCTTVAAYFVVVKFVLLIVIC